MANIMALIGGMAGTPPAALESLEVSASDDA